MFLLVSIIIIIITKNSCHIRGRTTGCSSNVGWCHGQKAREAFSLSPEGCCTFEWHTATLHPNSVAPLSKCAQKSCTLFALQPALSTTYYWNSTRPSETVCATSLTRTYQNTNGCKPIFRFAVEALVFAVFCNWPRQPFWLLITLRGSFSCRYWETVPLQSIQSMSKLSLCGAVDSK